MTLINPWEDEVIYRGKTFRVGEVVRVLSGMGIGMPKFNSGHYRIRKFVPSPHYSGRVLDYVELELSSDKGFTVGRIVNVKMSSIKKEK